MLFFEFPKVAFRAFPSIQSFYRYKKRMLMISAKRIDVQRVETSRVPCVKRCTLTVRRRVARIMSKVTAV